MTNTTIKIDPKSVRKRLQKISDKIAKLAEEAKQIRRQCSHRNAVSRYHEYEDSGYECSGCGATWRNQPQSVGKVG